MTIATDRIVVIGVGSELRGDDGVGPVVAKRFAQLAGAYLGAIGACRVLAPVGDPLDLLGEWDGADLAVVVDATRSGLAPGTISVLESDLESTLLTERPGQSSTHGIGLAAVFRLARAVGRAPSRTVVVGIEGEDFAQGCRLSPSVDASVDEAVACVADLVRRSSRLISCRSGLRPPLP